MEKVCPTCQTEYGDDVEFCPHDGMKLRRRRGGDDEDPMIDRILDGRWVIESRIGMGGMGAVYLGHQRSVDRKVAIKTLRSSLADTDDFVDRFFREARVATTINHPHCVTIHDFGQDEDGTLYLAMEFLEGQDLTSRISDGDISIEEALRIGSQIASALSAAHQANIVHRDLKPDNIFLLDISDGSTFVKVLDFGIAKVMGADTQMTKTGQVFGTPAYMSPEQCQGHTIDGRSDLYSLGCILYELVGGRPPFEGETPMAVLMAHVANDVPPLSTIDGVMDGVDPRVEQEIMALLSKDPDGRPATASEAKQRLNALLSSLNAPDLSYTAPQQVPRSTAPTTATAASSRPQAPDTAPADAASGGDIMTTAQIQRQAGFGGSARIAIVAIIGLLLAALVSGAIFTFAVLADDDEDPVEIADQDEAPLEEDLAAADDPDHDQPADDDEELAAADDLKDDADDEEDGEASDDEDDEELQERAEADSADDESRDTASPRERDPAPRPRPRPRPEPVVEPEPEPAPRPTPRPAPSPAEPEEEEDDPLDFFGDD